MCSSILEQDTDPDVAPAGYRLVPVFSSGAAIIVTIKSFGPSSYVGKSAKQVYDIYQ